MTSPRRPSRTARRLPAAVLALVVAMPTAFPAQQPLDWSADDATRIATLAATGRKLEGAHVVVWVPPALPEVEAAALVARLDRAVPALRALVGTHDWQALGAGPLTYYVADDAFVSHATGRGALFVPVRRVRDGTAPLMHEALHELLASTRRGSVGADARSTVRLPLWLTEGLPEYIAQRVADDLGLPEPGPFASGGLRAVDETCAGRARTADGAAMLGFIGRPERPALLFTTDRARYAPTFYSCALSFTRFLVARAGLERVIALFGLPPAEAVRRLEDVARRPLADVRAAWLRTIGLL
jgi:hypothetical protein